MEENTKKRGRPAIKPSIARFIASKVSDEQRKPQETRMPVKVLAFEIREQLKQLGERPPELSTLEKKISEYRKRTSPEDKPWSLSTLDDYPISPEALPKVLEEYKLHYRRGFYLTIRQAKWITRLSATQCDASMYIFIAMIEQLSALLGTPYGLEAQDMELAGLKEELDSTEWVPGSPISPSIWSSLQPRREEFKRKRGTE